MGQRPARHSQSLPATSDDIQLQGQPEASAGSARDRTQTQEARLLALPTHQKAAPTHKTEGLTSTARGVKTPQLASIHRAATTRLVPKSSSSSSPRPPTHRRAPR